MRIGAVLPFLLIALPLHAQTGVRPPQGWSLSVLGGGAAFTDFRRSADGVLESGVPGDRRIGPETAGAFGGAISYWPGRNWGVRLHGLYAPTRFKDGAESGEAEAEAGLTVSGATLELIFRMPTIHARIMPYGIAGGGVLRYSATGDPTAIPVEVRSDFAGGVRQLGAGVIGVGARLGLRPRAWALDFELTDHFSGTPASDGGTENVRVASTVTFMVGVTWLLSR